MKYVIGALVFLIIGVAIGIFVFIPKVEDQPTPTEVLSLPSEAVKLSECVPNMGFHYADPVTMPFGPVYLLDQKDKVVALEYIITESELKENIIQGPYGRAGIPVAMNPLSVVYDHVDLAYMPEGIGGFEVPHYQVHYFVISAGERALLCEGLIQDDNTQNNGASFGVRVGLHAIYVSDMKPGTSVQVGFVELVKKGYVIIHAVENGKPGKILGASDLLREGRSEGIEIELKSSIPDGTELIAMLHKNIGDARFSATNDPPVTEDGNIIFMRFQVSSNAQDGDIPISL